MRPVRLFQKLLGFILMKIPKTFFAFSSIGIFTFALSFVVLGILIEQYNAYYLTAAGIAFIIDHTLQYSLAQYTIFRKSRRPYLIGYQYFLSFAVIHLLLALGLMKIAVEYLSIHYLFAQILVVALLSIGNFFINARVTFRSHSHAHLARVRRK